MIFVVIGVGLFILILAIEFYNNDDDNDPGGYA